MILLLLLLISFGTKLIATIALRRLWIVFSCMDSYHSLNLIGH